MKKEKGAVGGKQKKGKSFLFYKEPKYYQMILYQSKKFNKYQYDENLNEYHHMTNLSIAIKRGPFCQLRQKKK